MGKLKKIGIGFGVIIGLFFVIVIAVGVSAGMDKENMTLEELAEYDKKQAIIDAEKREEMRILREQQWLEYDKEMAAKQQAELKDAKLSNEELQKIIAGFESYNKSVKILLDTCASVESEDDFSFVMQLIDESGDNFLASTTGYGTIRNTLITEGYGEHSELGPLMNETMVLVDQMSTCMEVLSLEFSG